MAKAKLRRSDRRRIAGFARRRPILFAAIAAVVIVAIVLAWYFNRPTPGPVDGTVEIHMIDVGNADAYLLYGKEGVMLIDTGDNKSESTEALLSYLDDAGIETIEWLVLTHPDADHIGGAVEVFESYDVKRLMLSDRVHDTNLYADTVEAALAEGCEIHLVETDTEQGTDTGSANVTTYRAGDDFTFSLMQFRILGPYETTENNNSSVVLRMQYGETVALFMGDAEEDEELDILANISAAYLDCDILKVGHHGSASSTTDQLLDAATPSYAFISCGEENKYGHPHSETVSKLNAENIAVYRADLMGSVVLVLDGTDITRK